MFQNRSWGRFRIGTGSRTRGVASRRRLGATVIYNHYHYGHTGTKLAPRLRAAATAGESPDADGSSAAPAGGSEARRRGHSRFCVDKAEK